MSVRVVKRGKVPVPQVWEGRCRHCNSVLEAFAGSLFRRPPADDRGWGLRPADEYVAPCPVCGRTVEFRETSRTELTTPV